MFADRRLVWALTLTFTLAAGQVQAQTTSEEALQTGEALFLENCEM